MIRLSRKGACVLSGTVSKVSCRPKGAVTVSFRDSNGKVISMEFKNGKMPRADIVRKLHVQKGDPVIAVGAKSRSSGFYYGWELKKGGVVSAGGLAATKGTITAMEPCEEKTLMNIEHGGTALKVSAASPMIRGIAVGDEIALTGFAHGGTACRFCQGNSGMCEKCGRKEKRKAYIAYALEKIIKEENHDERRDDSSAEKQAV